MHTRISPSVSTRICRFRPFTFSEILWFRTHKTDRVESTAARMIRRLNTLAVNDGNFRLFRSTCLHANLFSQSSIHPLERAVVPPRFEKLIHSSPGRELVRQHPPRTPCARDVKHRVNDFAHVGAARSSSRFGRGNQWYDPLPLRIGHVGRVSLPCFHDCTRPNLLNHEKTAFQTRS